MRWLIIASMQAGKFSPIPTIISSVTAMTSVGIVSLTKKIYWNIEMVCICS